MILNGKHVPAALILLSFCLLAPSSLSAAQDLEAGIQEIAQQLSTAMGSGKVKKLAVVEFPDLNGYQSALGQFIAEELITQLSVGTNAGQYDVVERRQLARVLQEQELTESSLFDAQSISKIGKILGIEAIVTGSVADLGTDVKINARVISIETAKIFAAASTKIPKTDTVLQLMRQNAGLANPQRGVTVASVQRSGVFFENNLVRVDVTAFSLSKDKKTAALSLTFQNATQEDIYLALDRCGATLIDNAGTVVPVEHDGEVYVTGLQCVTPSHVELYKDEQQKFARFGPAVKTPVIFTFKTEGDVVFAGNVFSFSTEVVDLIEKKPRRFTIGLSGIELLN